MREFRIISIIVVLLAIMISPSAMAIKLFDNNMRLMCRRCQILICPDLEGEKPLDPKEILEDDGEVCDAFRIYIDPMIYFNEGSATPICGTKAERIFYGTDMQKCWDINKRSITDIIERR